MSGGLRAVVSVGDGIVWISGLPSAQMDGLVVFADGSRAMVFDLCQDKLGAVLLDDTMTLTSGMPVFLAHEQRHRSACAIRDCRCDSFRGWRSATRRAGDRPLPPHLVRRHTRLR